MLKRKLKLKSSPSWQPHGRREERAAAEKRAAAAREEGRGEGLGEKKKVEGWDRGKKDSSCYTSSSKEEV